jgi:hypothetical protein
MAARSNFGRSWEGRPLPLAGDPKSGGEAPEARQDFPWTIRESDAASNLRFQFNDLLRDEEFGAGIRSVSDPSPNRFRRGLSAIVVAAGQENG